MLAFVGKNLSDKQGSNQKVTILIPDLAGKIGSADKVKKTLAKG